ncbi:MAG: PilZ domain-containing protein, partial [Planctomycetes bacterium]|nr:PilZ domain-containing protein [Planctomycetota bacterium]
MPPVPFDRRAAKRVPTRAVRVSIRGGASGLVGVDVSIEGVGVATPQPSPPGEVLELELDHRRVGVLSIAAMVAWSGEVAGLGRTGLQFLRPSIGQRTHLRRLMAAEVGSCVLDEDGRTHGFALTTAAGVWAVLDATALKVAVVHQDGHHLAVTHRPRGAAYDDLRQHTVDDLEAAVALALGATGRLRLDPPLGPRSQPVLGGRPAPATARH